MSYLIFALSSDPSNGSGGKPALLDGPPLLIPDRLHLSEVRIRKLRNFLRNMFESQFRNVVFGRDMSDFDQKTFEVFPVDQVVGELVGGAPLAVAVEEAALVHPVFGGDFS